MSNTNYELTVIQEENGVTRVWPTDKITFGKEDGVEFGEFTKSPEGNVNTLLNTGCITVLNSKGCAVYTHDFN